MSGDMWALVYDRKKDPWERSKGLRRQRVPRPTLDVARDYRDASMVVVKPRSAKSMALAPTTSSHTRTHLPHIMQYW